MKREHNTVIPLCLGTFLLDGGAMFGVVPKPIWETRIPADNKNRIPMETRVLLIRGGDRILLVDTGMGDKMDNPMQNRYGASALIPLPFALANCGITPEMVTDVILSHLHFDHCGGATCIRENEIVPAFPNATYHVQEKHMAHATSATARDKASFLKENIDPLRTSGQLHLVKGEEEIAPGISVLVTEGHTTAQQHPLIHSKGEILFYSADIFPTSHHLSPRWTMAYDNQPEAAIREKEALLKKGEEEGWIFIFEHDPEIEAGTIRLVNGKPVVTPVRIRN